MVENENASYGFRRNLFGIKPLVLCVAIVSAIVTGIIWWVTITVPITLPGVWNSVRAYPYLLMLFALDLAYAVVITFMVTSQFVRQAADDYALALFRTLDQPQIRDGGERTDSSAKQQS
jgi:hypothetical protein